MKLLRGLIYRFVTTNSFLIRCGNVGRSRTGSVWPTTTITTRTSPNHGKLNLKKKCNDRKWEKGWREIEAKRREKHSFFLKKKQTLELFVLPGIILNQCHATLRRRASLRCRRHQGRRSGQILHFPVHSPAARPGVPSPIRPLPIKIGKKHEYWIAGLITWYIM